MKNHMACGLPNIIPYMYYFWDRDVKNDYYTKDPVSYAKQHIQRFIYAVNQPNVRDGIQSAFTNVSIFDHEYLHALFDGSVFPDGAFMVDEIEGIYEFQKLFMEVVSEIRSHNMFTFPILTMSMLRVKGKFKDEEFARWAVEHNRKWNDSNFFIDDSVTSLSNCCFDGNQMTLTKSSDGVNYMSFKDLYEAPYQSTKRNFTVFHNGLWRKGKIIRLPKRNMYKVTTANNKEILVTDNHINVTLRGDIQTSELTTDDYLMFNTQPLNLVKEVDEKLTYEQGYLVGLYAGDGCMSQEDKETFTTVIELSLNEYKYNESIDLLEKACEQITGDFCKVRLGTPYNNVYPVRIGNSDVALFIRRFIKGKYSFEKEINMDCLLQSYDFRKGILDGYYMSDGGNSNRIYTSSKNMVGNLETLITSLGMQSIIDISDRTGEDEVVIRGKSFNRNYPIYCVRWYESCNRSKLKDVYVKHHNSTYFKIKNITPYETEDDYVYCFEVDEVDPYFTLPNGIITHNCRLKSNIEDLGYFNSVGGTALKVGSVKVSTINLARIALETETEEEYIERLKDLLDIDMKVLDIVRHIIKRNVEKGLLPNFTSGMIDFEHLYNTIGICGIYESIKKFGYTYQDEFGNTFYSKKADEFGEKIFKTIHDARKEFMKDNDYQINVEQVPAEQCAVKFQKADEFFFPDTVVKDLPLYGNQFIPLGIKTTMQERIRIASLFDNYCSGGSICHLNCEAPLDSFEKAWDLTNYIADQKLTYFAYNVKIQSCESNHAFFGKVCPVCGKPVATEYTRIVGFYTPIRTWSTPRKEEFKLREWEKVNQQ